MAVDDATWTMISVPNQSAVDLKVDDVYVQTVSLNENASTREHVALYGAAYVSFQARGLRRSAGAAGERC
ncbi:MAG: hypothetical protein U0573_10595 [Phycisphaerales bacterium]